MEKHIINEQTGISYTLQGDYYLPDLAFPDREGRHISLWGQRHLRYIRKHKRLLYTNLLMNGKLNSYLADVDRQAEEMYTYLVKELAEKEGITESLKATDQIAWIGAMNTIRNRAMEVVKKDLIYA